MPPSLTKSFQILVVEDEEDMRKLLKQILEGLGCRVLEVFKAKDALTHLEAGGIDLMLLDIQLPEINGIETLRRTRKDNPTPTPS